jgi:hypothetical protein
MEKDVRESQERTLWPSGPKWDTPENLVMVHEWSAGVNARTISIGEIL